MTVCARGLAIGARGAALAAAALLACAPAPLLGQGTCLTAIDSSSEPIPFGVIVDNSGTGNGTAVSCVGGASGNDVWILLPALTAGAEYRVATGEVGGSIVSGTRLEIFHGTCSAIQSVVCSDDGGDTQFAAGTFTAADSGPYQVLVEGVDPGQAGEFLVTLTEVSTLQANAICDFALDVTNDPLPLSVSLDTTDGSDVAGVSCGDGTGGADRWVKLPPLEAGKLFSVYTTPEPGGPSEVDTRLEVFEGTGCGALTSVGCNDNESELSAYSSVSFLASAGSSYWAFVESAGSGTDGPFRLNVDAGISIGVGGACFNAIPVTGSLPISIPVDLVGGTSVTDVSCGPLDGAPEVWYQLPPLAGNIIYLIETAAVDPVPDTRLEVFTGTCGSLTQVACSDDVNAPTDKLSRVTFQGDPGKTFYVLVESDPRDDGSNDFSLRIDADSTLAPPTNETCVSAEFISASTLPTTRQVDVRAASDDADLVPPDAADQNGVDVFYRFTPTASGRYTFYASFLGEGTELSLSLLSDPSCATVIPLCGTPVTAAAPVLSAFLQGGTPYQIALDDPDSSTKPTSYTLIVSAPDTTAPAVNATCATAAAIGSLPFTATRNSIAGQSALELASQVGGDACLGELYYVITPVTNRSIIARAFTAGDQNPAVIGVYTGACAALAADAPVAVGEGRYNLQPGVTYRIVVEPYSIADQGNLTLEIDELSIPDGDYCPKALEITSVPFAMAVELEGAGDEGIEGPCVFADSTGNKRDMFWTFTPALTGNYRIDAGEPGDRGSGADTSISVYTGDCGALTTVACRNATDAGEFLTVELQAGVAYLIQVEGDGVLSTGGLTAFDFSVAQVPAATEENDCKGALELTELNLPFAENIDTSGNNGFSPHRLVGPTHTYRLTSNERALVTVVASPQTAGLDAAIAVFNDTCDFRFKNWYTNEEGSAVANGSGAGGDESLTFEVRRDEPVIIYIESADKSGGSIDVSITIKQIAESDGWLAQ